MTPPNSGLPPMPMEGLSPETREALREWELGQVRKELEALKKQVEEIQEEKDRAMKWGIITLGTILISIGSWAINLIISHLPGTK